MYDLLFSLYQYDQCNIMTIDYVRLSHMTPDYTYIQQPRLQIKTLRPTTMAPNFNPLLGNSQCLPGVNQE